MGSLVAGVQARHLAEGGIQLVIMNLLTKEPESRLLGDGETLRLDLPDGQVELTVNDEAGKIDINIARPEMLARLFYSFEMPQEQADALADAVIDYRDPDDLTGLNGAEDDDYLAAGLTWEAKDSAFTNVSELQWVFGMQPWILDRVLPHVTIYSRQKGINPEVASLQILLALSDDSPIALESYVQARRENHLAGIPLPTAPHIGRQFLSQSRGHSYTLLAVGSAASKQQSAITTTVRIRRGSNRQTVNTLNWLPYRSPPVAVDANHVSLSDGDEMSTVIK